MQALLMQNAPMGQIYPLVHFRAITRVIVVSRAGNLKVGHQVLDVVARIVVPRRCAPQVHTAKQSQGKGVGTTVQDFGYLAC